MSFWQTMFQWPDGGVYSNLLASLLWLIPSYLWGKKHLKKLHKRMDYHDAKLKAVHKDIKR